MYNTEEKLVEIARFSHPTDAAIPISLLESEGILCFMHNAFSTQVMGGLADRALEILRDGGYERYIHI